MIPHQGAQMIIGHGGRIDTTREEVIPIKGDNQGMTAGTTKSFIFQVRIKTMTLKISDFYMLFISTQIFRHGFEALIGGK